MTPAIMPGHSEPSRSKNFTPRNQPISSSTGNAPMERINACIIGGTSGNTSFTAIWLKPQLRHSISIKATAPGRQRTPGGRDHLIRRHLSSWPAWRRVVCTIPKSGFRFSDRSCQ